MFVGALALGAGIAGGYFATQSLLAQNDLVARLPERFRPAVAAARARLLTARQHVVTVFDEFERERASAEIELTRDYYSRVGRTLATGVPESPHGRHAGLEMITTD